MDASGSAIELANKSVRAGMQLSGHSIFHYSLIDLMCSNHTNRKTRHILRNGALAPNRSSQVISAETMVNSIEHALIKQRTIRLVETRLGKLRLGRKSKVIAKNETSTGLLSDVWVFETAPTAVQMSAPHLEDEGGDISQVDGNIRKARKTKNDGAVSTSAQAKKARQDAMKRKRRALKDLK